MTRIRTAAALTLGGALVVGGAIGVAAQATGQTADRVDNGPTATMAEAPELLVAENARIERTEDGLAISIMIPTPTAGEYAYPETVGTERQAQPEAFTGWAFIFNDPTACVSFPGEPFPCGPEDFNELARGGAYNFAGHVNSITQISGGELLINEPTEGMLVLRGEIRTGQDDHGAPPGNDSFALDDPMGAEVHIAIAPHGLIDPGELPGELYRPVGTPACDCWWVATFAPPKG